MIIPAASEIGNPPEDMLMPDTVAEFERLRISPREVTVDGGFEVGPTRQALERLDPQRTSSRAATTGRRRIQRRLAGDRTGTERRISHLRRGNGAPDLDAALEPRLGRDPAGAAGAVRRERSGR